MSEAMAIWRATRCRLIALGALFFVISGAAFAADNPVREVRAVDGEILCFAHRNLAATESSGPCDGYTAPSKVEVGLSFFANGKKRTIGVIQATQMDEDFRGGVIDLKKGDWYCVAGETEADLDFEHSANALWLFVPKCEPLSQGAGLLQLLPVTDFLKLPGDLQALYVGGLIDGMAFVSYGNSDASYLAWVSCVRSKTLGDTTKDVVTFIQQQPSFSEGVGSALAQTLERRCKH
jgi:hypothetical protein